MKDRTEVYDEETLELQQTIQYEVSPATLSKKLYCSNSKRKLLYDAETGEYIEGRLIISEEEDKGYYIIADEVTDEVTLLDKNTNTKTYLGYIRNLSINEKAISLIADEKLYTLTF